MNVTSAFDVMWTIIGVLGVLTGIAMASVIVTCAWILLRCRRWRQSEELRVRAELDYDELMERIERDV